MALRVEQG